MRSIRAFLKTLTMGFGVGSEYQWNANQGIRCGVIRQEQEGLKPETSLKVPVLAALEIGGKRPTLATAVNCPT